MLTATYLFALTPLILAGSTAIAIMLAIAWQRHHAAVAGIAAGGTALALLLMPMVAGVGVVEMALFTVDGLSLFTSTLVLLSTLVTVVLAYGYFEGYRGPPEEFYLLLLCGAAGAIMLGSATHLATLFFGLELLSMPLYGMLAYNFARQRSLESGIKYLVLSAAATAFLLFGMALLYARVGRLDLAGLTMELAGGADAWSMAGAAMMIIGLGFKLSAVPFHLWTPDVYEGGPAPTVAFLATVSKLAVFVILLRMVREAPLFDDTWLQTVLAGLALLSMVVGNLLALFQRNIKRLLAYSSIAHFGYLLVALVVGNALAVETTGVYLLTYVVTTLVAFGVVTIMSSPMGEEDRDSLADYRGLFWRRPWLAGALTLALLSLAGIPLTAGFIGKFYVIALGVDAQRWWLVLAIVLGSAIGLYYYLRVMLTLYQDGDSQAAPATGRDHRLAGTAVLILTILIIYLGVYPMPMIDWAASLAM